MGVAKHFIQSVVPKHFSKLLISDAVKKPYWINYVSKFNFQTLDKSVQNGISAIKGQSTNNRPTVHHVSVNALLDNVSHNFSSVFSTDVFYILLGIQPRWQ